MKEASEQGIRWKLILAGFLALFLELALIRWLPGNVLSLAYFSNLVLIASFLGLGIGFILPDRFQKFYRFFPVAFFVFIVISLLLRFVQPSIPDLAEEALWSAIFVDNVIPLRRIVIDILPTLGVLMLLVTGLFVFIGARISQLMRQLPPLTAYGYDLLGSLGGIAVFTAFSFAGGWFAHPVFWFAMVGLIGTVFATSQPLTRTVYAIGTVFLVTLLLFATHGEVWSPYYRINMQMRTDPPGAAIAVNQFFFQRMVDFNSDQHALNKYGFPYLVLSPKRVLVLGAGTGNDVAVALRNGAEHVDAVEIDPAIAQIGKEQHPDKPYDDPRVTLHIDDARSYLANSKETYDLIVMGTLDSHALLSARSTVRLDNFMYTQEALQSVRERLAEEGTTLLLFSVPKEWISEKIVKSAQKAFGTKNVLVFKSEDAYLFNLMVFAGPSVPNLVEKHAELNGGSAIVPESVFSGKDVTYDDWPYLYLREHDIPAHYLQAIMLLLAMTLCMVFLCLRRGAAKIITFESGTFFLLGAGFLLLETKSITTLSLLFGSTWVVNAVSFTGILAAMFFANSVASRIPPLRMELLYAILGLSLTAAFFFPLEQLLSLGIGMRVIVAAAIAGLPIFFASLIFSKTFERVSDLRLMYGVNLIGAVIGGFLEYSAMLTGINALYVIGAVLYFGAYLFDRERRAALNTDLRG